MILIIRIYFMIFNNSVFRFIFMILDFLISTIIHVVFNPSMLSSSQQLSSSSRIPFYNSITIENDFTKYVKESC